MVNIFSFSQKHDDLLFAALVVTGFHGLLHLGELTFPDSSYLRDWRKVTKRSTLVVHKHQYEFFLPAHKADRVFEGNKVLFVLFHLLLLTHVQFSFAFFLLAIIYFLLLHLYGSPQQVGSLLVPFLCLAFVVFSLKLLRVLLCELVVLPISLLLVHPLKSSEPSADGPLMPGKFTFAFIPPFFMPFY